MGQACTPEQLKDVDWCHQRSELLEDGAWMSSRSVVPGKKRSDRCRLRVGGLWSALEKTSSWRADLSSEAWRALLKRHPRVSGDWDLIVVADVAEAINGVPFGEAYCLKVLIGNEPHGRSTFSSSSGYEWPPRTGPTIYISGTHFQLSLWPLLVNGIGQQLLSSLTGFGYGDEDILGEDEAPPEEGQPTEFFLAGVVDREELKGPLELRVRWTQYGVLQNISLPFVAADTLTDKLLSLTR